MGFKSSDNNHSGLYDRVQKLLVSYKWSDCSFSVGGKDIKAHKLILGISSPVFEAMFYGPMSSSEDIVITDIEPDVFQLLLNYIYTDEVEITSIEEAFELSYASRKYLLEPLTDRCIAYIQANISLDNVATILNYPEFMQDKELTSSALKLFCEHADYLLKHYKKYISPSCMKTVLESDQMNIKEKDLIKHVFDWTDLYCEQNGIPKTIENKRDLLIRNGLLEQLRFFTLSSEEMDEVLLADANLLLNAEINCIKKVIAGSYIDDKNMESCLGSNLAKRSSMKLQWHFCYRSPLRSMPPIFIDARFYSVATRIKSCKPVFITSLCVPTRMAPVLNFRNDTPKIYAEQILVSVVDEADNSIITLSNFMNNVEYNSMVDIELSEPCCIMKDKWYTINFVWPQIRSFNCSYGVEYRDRFYEDHRVTFEFEDLPPVPGLSGCFLSGLKYCL